MTRTFTFLRLCLLAMLLAAGVPTLSVAADADDSAQTSADSDAPPKINAAVELPKMQKILDKIKGQVSGENNDAKLEPLNEMAL